MEPRPSASASRDDPLRAALEEFIQLHDRDAQVDLAAFVARFPAGQRQEIERRCLAYLEMAGRLEATRGPAGDAVDDPEPLETLGDFRLLRELGRGGMGVVYLARQVSLGRLVALKVLRPHLAMTATQVERFRREAAAVARLNHPGIVPVHAVGEQGGTHFYAMEYVRGESLYAVIARLAAAARGPGAPPAGVLPRRSTVAAAAEAAAQIAETLHHAHEQGVVHRDVKPQNVMIDEEDRLRLLDFGLAKDAAAGSQSLSGELHGTPYYMSPEQTLAKRVAVDRRTDVFSLGVLLYELLTLKRPFEGDSVQEILYQISFKEPAPVRLLESRVPRDLETICMRALEKDPERRYATAGEMAKDLRRFLRHEPILARPAGPLTRSVKWIRRHRHAAVTATVLVLVPCALLLWQAHRAATDAAMAGALLDEAARHGERGDLDAALQALVRASEKAPRDELVRERLAAAQQALAQRAREDQLRRDKITYTEGVRLLVEARDQLEQRLANPGLALLLAVEGAQRAPGRLANGILLDALAQVRERRTLIGHQERVETACFAPDGKTVLTAGWDWTARLFRVADGAEVTVLNGHRDVVHTAAFDHQGRRVVTASADRTARVWDVARGQTELVLRGHGDAVRAAVFSADDRLIATASMDGTVRLWDAASGEPRATFTGPAGLRTVAFRGDGRQLIAATELQGGGRAEARVCVVWDVASGQEVFRSRSYKSPITCVGFAPAPGQLLLCSGNAARVLDQGSGDEVASYAHPGFVVAAAFAPDGQRLATASWDFTGRVWDATQAGEQVVPLLELRGHRGELSGVAFAADGGQLVTASHDRTARVWDVRPDTAALPRLASGIDTAALSDDGARLVLASWADGSARVWDLGARQELRRLTARDARLLPPARFAPDGQSVLAPASDGSVRVFRPDGSEAVLAARRTAVCSIACAGNLVAVATCDGAVRLWSWPGLQELGGLRSDRVRRVVLTPDGRTLLTSMVGEWWTETGPAPMERWYGGDVAVGVWDVASLQQRRTHEVKAPVDVVTMRDSGSVLLTSMEGARRLDLHSGQLTPLATGSIQATAADPTGQRIAIAGFVDSELKLVAASDGAVVGTLHGHKDKVSSLAWSPDGSLMAAGSRDGTCRLWQAASGEPVATLRSGDPQRPESRPAAASTRPAARPATLPVPRWVGFGDGGRVLLTLDTRGAVRQWPVDVLAAARALRPRSPTGDEQREFKLLPPEVHAARQHVDQWFAQLLLRDEVEAQVRAAADLTPAERAVALQWCAEHQDAPWRWDERAWELVREAGGDASAAPRALRLADAALAREPDHERFLRTRGAALYRLQRLDDALAALGRAEELQPRLASALAFLAMTSQRLGYDGKARALRERLRALEDQADLTPGLLQEVDAVLAAPAGSRPGR